MSMRGHLPPGSVGERLSLHNQGTSSDIDAHTQTMADPTKHEEEKLRAVQEIWDKTEVYIAQAVYFHAMEKFMKTVLNYLQESAPQFIAENTVQKLRQKCLELVLRMACHESTKSLAKDISKVTLRLIQIDNEKNAVLGLKILNDVWKQNKIYFIPEISSAVSFLKSIVKEMSVHLNNGMFEPQEFQTYRGPMPPTLDDNLVESYLNHCYHIQFIAVAGTRGDKVDFTLIPRSSVSLKVVQELSIFFVYVFQHHKQTMITDVMEFLHISIEFIGLQLPDNYKEFTGMVKEIMDDFHTAQSKILGFLMIMGKIPQFMDVMIKHGVNLLKAILTLLETLDDKNVVIRKEILASLKFCFATDLKNNVVGFLPRLLDEDCIIGRGYTSKDNLRVFLYQILADLLHHIRFQLSFPLMLQASAVFCREMADPSLSFQTQVMCVRLLCSICEALPKMETLGEASRDMLWQTLDHLQYKMERIATYHLPLLIRTYGLEDSNGKRITHHELLSQEQQRPSSSGERSRKASQDQGLRTSTEDSTPTEEVKDIPKDIPLPEITKKNSRFTKPDQMMTDLCAVASPSMTIPEARNFVKYLLMTVKICCANISTTARSNLSYPMEKERDIMENILKYGLICMDVFMLPNSTKNQPVPPGQRGKEEKEALDVFAHVFVAMDTDIYKEIFAKHICTIIERINSNSTVQLFANAFLVRSDFVCRFGGIMIRYLMDNMDKLAVSNDRTTLYVKLFKIIFSAIGCGQQITTEGEMMLKPYLPDLIRKATEFALTAKEPLNYFLLLRALFRSIGGGAHDILYGQFLPLLPNLLQFLNKLQSCNHRITMRELFLELCLTVPVRLSSLLPYLPLLMDPLVCALNGSTSLVQQGLRTLELCVDNLQPEYLFEHMAPVRSALIQGLWRVLSSSGDAASAQTAFRILGKFGGANRRILSCPQTLTYINDNEGAQACICIEFPRNSPELPPLKLDFSLSELMQTAGEQMGTICYRLSRQMMAHPDSTGNISTLIPSSLNQAPPGHYQLLKEASMGVARCILSAALCPDPNMSSEDWKHIVVDHLKDALKRLDSTTPNYVLFRGVRPQERKMYINALVIIMIGVIQKDMRPHYVNFYMGMVRQLTINALLESISPPELLNHPYNPPLCMDGSILVDALIEVLGDTNKEFLNSAVFCLSQFCDTCDVCIPDRTRWIQFPIIRHLIESVCNLCNGPAWFARLGGANGLLYIIKSYPVELLRHYVVPIVESLCEVIVGLSDEISSGAVDMSVSALVNFHKRVFTDYDMIEDKMFYLNYIVRIYLPLIFHNIEYVREKAWELLNSLKDVGAPPMKDLLEHHRDILFMNKDRIVGSLRCMSMTEQEASLAALNTLLEIIPEHTGMDFADESLESFFTSVFDLCENDVHTLLSRNYYKSMDTCPGHFLPPYPLASQMESLKAVAIESIIVCYKVLCKDQPGEDEKKANFSKKVLTIAVQSGLFGPERIQISATKALNKCAPIPMEVLKEVAGNIISSFDESDGSLDVEKITQMEKLIGFNTELWNKELATKFVEQIKSWQTLSASEGFPARSVEDIKAIQSVMRLLMEGDVLDLEMVLKLVDFLAFFDLNYTTDTDFGFTGAICTLISKYPQEIVRRFCARPFLSNYVPFFCKILEHDRGQTVRDVLKNDNTYLEKLLQLYTLEGEEWKKNTSTDLESCIGFEESIVKIVDTLSTKEADWFESNHQLLDLMRKIWSGMEFKVRYNVQPIYREENLLQMVRVSLFPASKINVPHMYGRNFIRYLKNNPDNIEMLFDLMHAFDGTFGADFAFIRDFLENELIPNRSIPWRVKALEHVLQKLEKEPEKYLKAPITSKMFQYVILPCLQFVFERYHSDDILGPGLPPDEESTPDPNHCMTRLTNIIEKNRHIGFSESNVIAMYQLCTMLVEYAPTHIHNNECKKQGTRLRTFMVFVWNTLTTGSSTSPTTHAIDPTVRFTGYLFLAHLIDKFTINRKIVLQVFNTLIAQYQLDNRDLIRKAIDVVTPAVPIRLIDDGYQQLLIHIKKVLAEESHNMGQIQHVVQAVCRNYRVYYHVRHELIQPLLSSVTRILHCTSGAVEGLTGRRLSLDVCEMAIKWELLKKREEETESSQNLEVESYLETLKNGEKDDQSDDIKKEPKQTVISKDHIDQIVTILLKFACTLQYQGSNPNAPSAYLSTTNELARRAQGLLRASLKPYVWGEVADIRYQWIEKQLTIPSEYANSRPESQHVFAQHIQQAQTTLEVLLALASSMNRPLLLSVLKPLQRSLISCMIGNYTGVQGHSLVKTMNYLLGKLLDKSKGIVNPLEDLETLNQYIAKYINDALANYVKGTTGMVQSIFTPFSVLRSIQAHQPNYLDITCMTMFLRVLEKVVREQVSIHPGQENSRDKTTIDFLLVAMELVRTRTSFMSPEQKRMLIQGILLPLIEKTHYEKVFECLFKMTLELLTKHTDRSSPNPGLALAVRLHVQMDRRLQRLAKDPHSYPLMTPYLNLIHTIFDNPVYQTTEHAPRVYGAFYWGLTSPDHETRRKFLVIWERNQDPFFLARFMFCLKDESWQNFRKYYWIRHVIWLLTQSCLQKPYGSMTGKRNIYFRDCTTLAKTLEIIAGRDTVPSLGAMSMDPDTNFNSPSENGQEPMDTSEPAEKTVLDKLVDGQRHFLQDAMAHDTSQMLFHVHNLLFNMTDNKFTPKIFKRLFSSLWYELLSNEKQEVDAAIVPFLTSGAHNHHAHNPYSVLTTWLEAVDSIRGEIKLPAKLVHYISKTHNAWHKGLLHLEVTARYHEHRYNACSNDQIRDLMTTAVGDSEGVPYREALDYLALLYKDMEELDPYAAIWNRRAIKKETVAITNRIQRGEIREAHKIAEDTIIAMGESMSTPEACQTFTMPLDQEMNHLFDQYTTCSEELLDWERMRDYANHNTVESPYMLMKAAMHLPDWPMVRDCLDQLVGCVPQKHISDYHLYHMMALVMHPRKDPNEHLNPLQSNPSQLLKQKIEKFVDDTVNHHIIMWRGLPSIVSHSHYKVLQAASLIREVADCVDLRIAIEGSNPREFNNEVLNQMKHIIKVWRTKCRNRLCCSADDLSYYSLVYDWRIQIHQMTLRRLEEWDNNQLLLPHGANSQTILPVHSAAQGQMVVARAAKSMRNYELAIDQMNKLHTISAVPAMDAHTKICEHLKVIRQQADRTVDPRQKCDLYQLGLHLLNETDITYFAADQVSRIFTIRGQFLGGLDKREEAVKAFSHATQILMEKQPTTPPTAAFKAWGDQQDSVLQNDQTELAAMTAGAGALSCFLEVARSVDSESRPKKYIAKLLWTGKQMVALGDSATIRLNDIIEKNERTTVSYNWLPWVPQLITEVVHRPNASYVKILARVCEDFPLQIFYNLRCIFADNITDAVVRDACLGGQPFDMENSEEWIQKLVPLMKQAISYRPADCRMFHELLSQMGSMREFWSERQHRYAVSVRNEITNCIHRQNPHVLPQDMVLDQEAIDVIMTWKADFDAYADLYMAECEIRYLADEFYAVPAEEEFIRGMTMEIQGFFSMCPCIPGTIVRYLEQVTTICKKLYMRLVYLPKKIPLKLASPWLASFTNKMACIEMPKDLFNVQKTVGSSSKYTSSQYTSMLGRLDPYFSISLEGGEVVRKIYMRSINGKSCTYYLKKNVKDRAGAFECGQFMIHLNQLLAKERETSRRFLQTCVMNQVYVGYGCELIETSGGVIGENQLVGAKSPVLHPYDILRQRLSGIGMHPDDMVVLFYDRVFPFFSDTQAKKQQEVHLRQQVLIEYGEEHFIGRSNMMDWAMQCYPDATMYYNFRKQVAKHMAVHNMMDFLLQLAPTQLQDIYITRSFGQYTIPNCAFQHPEKMEAGPVPFRLTHNFYNFLGYSADGDMRYCSEATISCMRYRSPEVYLRPLLWDFVAEVHPNQSSHDHIMTVNHIINAMRQRILTHDKPNDPDSADQTGVASLMKIALTTEALSQTDPAAYPWF